MVSFDRRQFLQSAAALLGAGYALPVFGDDAPVFAPKASFEPLATFLTWQGDPTTTMTVQWVGSKEEGEKRPVWYSKEGSMEWKQSIAASRPFPMLKHHIFRTELTGLEPGTDYRFRIGLDSAEKKFRTMPNKATNTIEFISGGDAGVGEEAQHTNHVAAKQSPSFVFLGGDLAYENGTFAPIFLQFLKNYSSQLIDEKGRLIPLLGCLGNHEVRGGYRQTRKEAPFFYSIFDGLFKETGYASLDFGDYMTLIFLDSNHTTPIEGEQTAWLAKTLKDRQECPNIFVFYHVPSYPSFRPIDLEDDEAGTGAASRKHWVPLFERHNVDAVFEHHDHTFKRTHPLIDGRVDSKGILYLGDGSWGKIRTPKSPKERPYLAVTHEAYHLSLHRIEGDDRFHVALTDSGKIVDVCATRKKSHLHPASS